MAYLITHSLLSAWLRTFEDNSYGADEPSPWAGFMRTLRREYSPPTEAMQKGIDFENAVSAVLDGRGKAPTEAIANMASILRGSVLQLPVNKRMEVDGWDIVLHGRLDALNAGVIYDIKYSGRYERGKFFNSTQHPTYFELVPEANTFIYLVSDGSNIWTETYERWETRSIIPDIQDFFAWLGYMRLTDEYKKYWEAK